MDRATTTHDVEVEDEPATPRKKTKGKGRKPKDYTKALRVPTKFMNHPPPPQKFSPDRITNEPVTKGMAERFLSFRTFRDERGIDDSNLWFLGDAVYGARFQWELVNIVVVQVRSEENATYYRGNGQHTCTLLSAMPVPPQGVKVRWLYYTVENQAELRQLYSNIDQGKGRTQTHRMVVLFGQYPEYDGTPHKVLSGLAAATRLWQDETLRRQGQKTKRRNDYTPERVIKFLRTKHYAETLAVTGFFNKNKGSDRDKRMNARMYDGPVLAAMMESLTVNSRRDEDALRFWAQVRDGLDPDERLKVTTPSLQLRDYLKQRISTLHEKAIDELGKRLASKVEQYRTCVWAYNRWANGMPVKKIWTPGEPIEADPIRVPQWK